jgi:uncharacterized protein Yka (UPF0111/DUF47 family)
MPKTNPEIAEELRQAREELKQLKAEKLRLFPPNPHPLAEPDRFPNNYTPEAIRHRNELVAQIESLERRIDELQEQLYRS